MTATLHAAAVFSYGIADALGSTAAASGLLGVASAILYLLSYVALAAGIAALVTKILNH